MLFPVCKYLAACFDNESFGLKSSVNKSKKKKKTELDITSEYKNPNI